MTQATMAELVQRREALMDDADAAVLASPPERNGSSSVVVLRRIGDELGAIVASMRSIRAPAVEVARTLRYQVSTLMDLGRADGQPSIQRAFAVIEEAETVLGAGGDAVEQAKLDFACANALRRLEPITVPRLEEAARRVTRARVALAHASPHHLPQVDELASLIKAMLALAREAEALTVQMEQTSERIRELQELLRTSAPSAMKPDAAVSEANQAVFRKLRARLEKDLVEGIVDADRAQGIADLIGRVERSPGRGESIATLAEAQRGLRDMALAAFEFLHYPSHGLERPPAGTRAAKVVEMHWILRRTIAAEMFASKKSEGEKAVAMDLSIRGTMIDRQLYRTAADDDRATRIEVEAMRPFALDVRRYAARRSLMLARPKWPTKLMAVDANALFYSGPSDGLKRVEEAARARGLRVLQPARGDQVGAARWNALRSAHLAVLDLGDAAPSASAQVFYDFGIARTIGMPVVVLVRPGRTLPFDIDIMPVETSADGGDASRARDVTAIADAIDEAMMWLPSLPDDAGMLETMDSVLRQFRRPAKDTLMDQAIAQLQRLRAEPLASDDRCDPVAVRAALSTLVDFSGDAELTLIQPAWRPRYPSGAAAKRLFHVMPFSTLWAPAAESAVRRACERSGAEYRRGDYSDRPDIIEAIWEDLALATHVLVDLTGFNANVALELGMSHVLGTPTRIVGQGDTVRHLFPAIAKERVATYDSTEGEGLTNIALEFLG